MIKQIYETIKNYFTTEEAAEPEYLGIGAMRPEDLGRLEQLSQKSHNAKHLNNPMSKD